MSEAEAFNNGPVLTPIGWLQEQINALAAGISGGSRIPSGTSLSMLLPGQPVLKGTSGNTAPAVAGINNDGGNAPLGIFFKDASDTGQIQTSGIVALTTDEWDAVTSQVGGLTPNATYCVGPGSGLWLIDCSSGEGGSIPRPVGAVIGVAISTTELVVTPKAPPATIGVPGGVTAAGMAVVQSASTLGGAIASSLAACVNTVGVEVLAGGADVSIVCLTGNIAELATTVWDTVTGQSGGLTKDAIYYLSATTAGHIVASNPPATTGTFAMQIGVALSATQLLVNIGTPIGPHA